MPEDAKFNSDITIVIHTAANGFVVKGHSGMGDNKMKYVYKTMDEVVKNLPAIYSILDRQKEPENEASMSRMKIAINSE